MMQYIDTHTHIDGEEFNDDRAETIARAKVAGVSRMFVPAIDLKSVDTVLSVCRENEGYAYPMVGLHPEEVKADWREQLQQMRQMLDGQHPFIAIGEVGLDYYWSRDLADEIAKEKGINVKHGVYVGVQGPTFETPAEYRMYRILGGDAVGMSTVPEVIVARHCGIKVFGISIITDLGGFDVPVEVSHEEVQIAANAAQPKMTEIMREMIRRS